MKIKALRQRAGLTQLQLAEAMGTGRSAVANWEIGLTNPKTMELPNLARVLGCSIDDLFEYPLQTDLGESLATGRGGAGT